MDPISMDMAPLLKQARDEGKWLWCHYQDMWFSPEQLALEQSQGRFRWGAVNWKLRDPREQLKRADEAVKAAQVERARIAEKLIKHGVLGNAP